MKENSTKNPNAYVIGITGGSASGKTHVLKEIRKRFTSDELSIISLDNYYFDIDEQPKDDTGQVNFDHPNAMNLKLFRAHIGKLLSGEDVSIREYQFNNPRGIEARMVHYHSAPILIVEGLFVFHVPEADKLFDLKIFIDADEHVKLIRRIRRDVADRGYPIEEVMEMYEQFVMPMYRKYIEPFKQDADVILPTNQHVGKAIEVLIDHLSCVQQRLQAARSKA